MDPHETLVVAERWGEAPGSSARTVLVTLFGDCLAPLGGPGVWLAQLADLASVFGYSERLVRTSLSRLAADNWVEAERVGRRSRYSLSAYGRHETQQAENRIYGPLTTRHADEWVLVLAGTDAPAALITHLRWRGFAEVSAGVWAHPRPIALGPADRGLVDPFPPTATAVFDDPSGLSRTETFRASTGLDETELAYIGFLDRYNHLATDPGGLPTDPPAAFALRTMLIHDYRRIRLAEPDLPPDVLGEDWVGRGAHELAAALYRQLSPGAWEHVASVTGRPVPDHAPITHRFPHHSPDRNDDRSRHENKHENKEAAHGSHRPTTV